ncbi:MAG: 16S rRNA (uracil(1498)-N(3))-methyltransferase [Gammaproteobacteria bacterium]|nr:16S rRNA (uracil(1498)-N(3))-methyltransferase [Gammaproteobacteria bacterium]
MRVNRVFVDAALETGAHITLPANAASHVTRVLRLRSGAAVTLFNGRGGEYVGTVAAAGGGEVRIAVGEQRAQERESPLALTLAQGISRGERMDFVVQKATELGVKQLVPLLTERSVVRLDAQQTLRKLNHWHAIAVAACEQSGRNRLPEVLAPATLGGFLRESAREAAGEPSAAPLRLLLSPVAASALGDVARPRGAVTVLIGPEGGLADSEHEAALAAGFTAVRLGPRVLRTETAAIVALALLQRQFGDL